MQRRRLGMNGVAVGAVGLGCWSFAGSYGPTDEARSHATLSRALDLGIDFLDTSNVYGAGVSEEIIGRFIKDCPGRFRIATKGGIRRSPGSTERTFDNSPAYLREMLEGSLRRLGVEHVDLYYIHRREQQRPIEEVMETLVRFLKEGKIGGIGFSEIAPASLRRAHAVHPVTAVQSEYSLWTRLPELGMVQTCKELGIAFVPFSPVGRGMFTGRTPDPATFDKLDFRKNNPRFLEPDFSANLAFVEGFRAFARERSMAPASLALAWLLHRGDHLIPIPGTRSPAHLEEHAAAADIALDAGDMQAIERLLPVGFAHGDRYSEAQNVGVERYC
ncbi:MAG: aldo/keto reductase [Geminicoccaceae bacterium]|nr:aldo/keto reductase [Geminicoccaceae bacterium]